MKIDKGKEGRELFLNFANEIRNENRYFVNPIYQEIFDIIIEQNQEILEPATQLFRGRIHKRFVTTPYTYEELGMPKPEIASSHGRSNPIGINYMYLSSNQDTVIAELRPAIDDLISIGSFQLTELQKVIRLSRTTSIFGEINNKWSSLLIANFMAYISHSFSRPIDICNKELEYLPSQYFSEYCKKKGFDGIIYLSSMMENKTEINKNYVFFNDFGIECNSVDVFSINNIVLNSIKIK